MASNFRVQVSEKNRNLDLKLKGDFDGTSACELLNILKDRSRPFVRISIDTEGLREIYPFGVDTFQKNLYLLKDRSFRLVFVGEHADRLVPENSGFFPSVHAETS